MAGFTANQGVIKVTQDVTTGGVTTEETVFDTSQPMVRIIGELKVRNISVDFPDLNRRFVPVSTNTCASMTWDGQCLERRNTYSVVDPQDSGVSTVLGSAPRDEDGRLISPDVVIMQAKGRRTLAGRDPRFDQELVSTLPTREFPFQGSVQLEIAAESNGHSWLRRYVSVRLAPLESVPRARVVLDSRTSSRQIFNNNNQYNIFRTGSARSTYSFDFKFLFGKYS